MLNRILRQTIFDLDILANLHYSNDGDFPNKYRISKIFRLRGHQVKFTEYLKPNWCINKT